MPLSDEELLAIAKKLALKAKKNGGSLCSIGCVKEDGKTVEEFNSPCHAPLAYDRFRENTPVYVVDGLYNWSKFWKEDAIEDLELFLNYFMNESPYAQCYHTKSAEEALEGGVILSTNHPANLIAGAMMFMRQLSETPKIVEVWVELFKAGVDPTLALILGHVANVRKEAISFTDGTNGHRPLNPLNFSIEDLKLFLMKTPRKRRLNGTLRDGERYSDVLHLWGEEGDGGVKFVESFLKKDTAVRASGWGARMVEAYSRENYAKHIADCQDEILIELEVLDV